MTAYQNTDHKPADKALVNIAFGDGNTIDYRMARYNQRSDAYSISNGPYQNTSLYPEGRNINNPNYVYGWCVVPTYIND